MKHVQDVTQRNQIARQSEEQILAGSYNLRNKVWLDLWTLISHRVARTNDRVRQQAKEDWRSSCVKCAVRK